MLNTSRHQQTFQSLYTFVRETSLLETALATLEWDERTGMPADAASYRADQITCLSGLIHQRRTHPKLGDWLNELMQSDFAQEPTSQMGATILGLKRDYDRHTLLPESLVKQLAHAITVGQSVWSVAKPENDFATFMPRLKTIVELRKDEAKLLSKGAPILYDSLLDQYEEDAKTQSIATVFGDLRKRLVALIQKIKSLPFQPDGKSLLGDFDLRKQREFSLQVAKHIGFQFSRGRLDETDHPFCTTLGPNDHRILTRYHADSLDSGLYGTLHEAGHGMYEQGLPTDWFGLPPGQAASLGVHESQSRFWENLIGRSHAFWKWCLPIAIQYFPALKGISVDRLFADLNRVEPSLIRIEADEATYNLHILLRFELEQELIDGTLTCDELPDAWAARYESYLGIRPKDYREGVMQDVHWAAGLIGYFPTYTLGNLFAAQLLQSITGDLGDLDPMISLGEFQPILDWLRIHVHQHGRCHKPMDLIRLATRRDLSSDPLLDYLENKLVPIHSRAL